MSFEVAAYNGIVYVVDRRLACQIKWIYVIHERSGAHIPFDRLVRAIAERGQTRKRQSIVVTAGKALITFVAIVVVVSVAVFASDYI